MTSPTLEDLKRFKHPKGDSRAFWFDGVSTLVVKAIYATRITPLQVNFAASVAGVLMGLSFAIGTLWGRFLGLGLFFVYVILDAVDGQLARARDDITLKGAYLDKMGHYIVYPVAGMAIGYGNYLATGTGLILWMGFLLGLSQTISSASRDGFKAVYQNSGVPPAEKIEYGRTGALKRLTFRLIRFETMLYLVVAAAVVDWRFRIAPAGLNLESAVIILYALGLMSLNLMKTYLFYLREQLYSR